MYRILHSMNNNVALAKNDYQEEVILIGSGIAFNKKKGDPVLESKIEKIFRLRTEESKENFMTLLGDVPLDFITITYDVIDRLSKKYDYPVQEYLYVTLTDHIYNSYKLLLEDNYKESDLPDASSNYPIPYKIAQEAVEIYRQKLTASFPDDEVNRIAYHFINAEGKTLENEGSKLVHRKEILHQLEIELRENGIYRTRENSHFYDRFMIHLNYFLDYIYKDSATNESLSEMEEQIQTLYPKAYQIASRLYEIVQSEVEVELHPTEKLYLALHIQRLL